MIKNDIDPDACVGIDSETCLIRKGLPCPPVVCTGLYYPERAEPDLYATSDQWAPIMALFADEKRLIVGHNFAYDICCYLEWGPAELRELIFKAYDDNRVLDTMLAQRLVEIETGDKRGKMSLDRLCARYGLECPKDVVDSRGDQVRLGYGKYLHMRLDEYEQCYVDYAAGDPAMTHKLFERILTRGLVSRADLGKMCRTDLGLKLTSAFGLKTDPERVDRLEDQARARLQGLQELMVDKGFMRWQRNKLQPTKTQRNIKIACAAAYDIDVDTRGMYSGPSDLYETLQAQGLITSAGSMSTARLVLEESGDPMLVAMADYGEWSAVWNKDLKLFRQATDVPFHTRFGFAATTRTTSAGPNIQNFRKKAGVRECIVSRYGALVASDYSGLENGTLAQVIVWTLGRRTMADKISAGWDFHSEVGAAIQGISYETMRELIAAGDKTAKMNRSAAKPLNFGLPGFMTRASTVQSYARIGYGVNLPIERWQELIDLWYATQHDQVAYLNEYVDGLKVGTGRGAQYNVPVPSTGIIRRGCTRTAAANTGFQGLGAQVAGEALYLVAKAQILGHMPGRVCAFIHDENITDCKVEDIDQVQHMQEKLMLQASERIMPDVVMQVETTAMKHWSKEARAAFDSAGRMVIDESC